MALGSLLGGGISKALSKIAPKLGKIIGKGSSGLSKLKALPGVGKLGKLARNPVVQAGVGGAATGAVIGYMADGSPIMGRRRRGRGFTSRDIRQTRRMLRLIKDMSGCVPKRKC